MSAGVVFSHRGLLFTMELTENTEIYLCEKTKDSVIFVFSVVNLKKNSRPITGREFDSRGSTRFALDKEHLLSL